jgi:hypothetical protein
MINCVSIQRTYLVELTTAGAVVQTIPLTSAPGNAVHFPVAQWNGPFIMHMSACVMLTRWLAGGKGPGDGALQLSNDKQYLVFGGYDGALGTDGVTTSANRVVGRVNSSGIVEKIATLQNTFSVDSFRY